MAPDCRTLSDRNAGLERSLDLPSLRPMLPVPAPNGMQYPLTFIADEAGVYRYVVVRPYIAARE
jgi:hypothetical protein